MEIGSALASAKALADLARTALEARDDAKARQAVADLQLRLFDAISAALATQEKFALAQEQLITANNELQQLKLKAEERDRYTLAEICPGSHAYASQPRENGQAEKSNAAPHYLCQPCFDKGVKAILRHVPAGTGTPAHWTCPENTQHRVVHHGTSKPYPPPRPADTRWPRDW